MSNLKQRLAENRGLQLPAPSLDFGDGPSGPETEPGPGANPWAQPLEALCLPPAKTLQAALNTHWQVYAPAWKEAKARLLAEKNAYEEWDSMRSRYQVEVDLRRMSPEAFQEEVGPMRERPWSPEEEPEKWGAVEWRPWPVYPEHPLMQHAAKPVVGWSKPKAIDPGCFAELRTPQALQSKVEEIRVQVWAEALAPEGWNLAAIPVAGYSREQPLRWLHCRLPEGVMPVENQALDLFTVRGRPVGSAVVRFPPMTCPPATLQSWIQANIPMLIALPH